MAKSDEDDPVEIEEGQAPEEPKKTKKKQQKKKKKSKTTDEAEKPTPAPSDEEQALQHEHQSDRFDEAIVTTTTQDEEQQQQTPTTRYACHFGYIANDQQPGFPAWIRIGITLWLLSALVLLINADVGSGIVAKSIRMVGGEIKSEEDLLTATIFSSVKELWDNGSYPLAVLIAITSIGWPYIKLALAFWSWLTPYHNPRRREFLIEIIDALGKWSFVDIVVLVEIMVAFRSSVPLGVNANVEIVIAAEWGFYGFVVATMMSLVSTHIILYYHRQRHYHHHHDPTTQKIMTITDGKEKVPSQEEDLEEETNNGKNSNHNGALAIQQLQEEEGSGSTKSSRLFLWLVAGFVTASLTFYVVGCIMDMYAVENSMLGLLVDTDYYSVFAIGQAIPTSASLDPSDVGPRFIQAMWYFLGVVMPLWTSFLFGFLHLMKDRLSILWRERLFFMGEIGFAWSYAEVLFVSTIFAVKQMPTFGDGLAKNFCTTCFTVSTQIVPTFAYLCAGVVLNVGVNIWLYRRAHTMIYHHPITTTTTTATTSE